jgi:hypothetical protein
VVRPQLDIHVGEGAGNGFEVENDLPQVWRRVLGIERLQPQQRDVLIHGDFDRTVGVALGRHDGRRVSLYLRQQAHKVVERVLADDRVPVLALDDQPLDSPTGTA